MKLLALMAAAALGIALAWLRHMHKRHGTGPLIWRWVSGHTLDGYHRTDASWLRPSTRVLHPTGRAVRWHHMRRLYRAAIRTGSTLGTFTLAIALATHRAATLEALATLGLIIALLLAWLVYRLRPVHHFRWVRPARRAITTELGVPPTEFKVARDRSEITIGLPPDRVLDAPAQKALEYVVTERLAIAAAPSWKQYGASPAVTLRRVEPPPTLIEWAAFEDACATAGPNELVVGMGQDGKIIKVSLTQDSPHFGISMGSGAGKSNLAAFWLLQELRRGAIALILDAKWTSHAWVFKDMDAEYGQLPCVRYCRRTEDLHDAMVWLDGEVERRSQVADRIINAKGDLLTSRGSVGPRLWVIAEEMNLAGDRLKQYWAEIREKGQPNRSPAFKGFGACSQAGRSLDIHMVVVAQQMTANAVGGGAVRENIGVRCLSRYTLNSWKMLAGELPMPPSVTAPGRVQCVVGPDVDEAQVPLMDLEEARDLVLAGDMTPVPAEMPGIATSVLRPTVLAGNIPAIGASDQGFDLGSPALSPARPPGTVTLREAVEGGLLEMKLETAQRASTRPGWPEAQGKEGRAHLYRISDLKKVNR